MRNLLLVSLFWLGMASIMGVTAKTDRSMTLTGSDCNNPTVVSSIPFQQSGLTTNGAGDDYNGSPCDADYMTGDDYVFAYTPTVDEYLTVRLENTGIFTGLHVLDACPDVATTCLGSDLSAQAGIRLVEDVELLAGTTYYIVVSTFSAPQSTNFDIFLEPGNPPPPGTDCGNTFPINSLPFNDLSVNTAAYGDFYAGSGPCQTEDYLNGNEIIYTYTPSINELISLRATNIDGFFAGLHVFDACLDDDPDCVASRVNDSRTDDLEIENLALEAGQSYYIVLSTWENPQSFTFDLRIVSERSCDSPGDFQTEEVTEDGALLSWTESGSRSNLLLVGAGQEPEGSGILLDQDTFRFTGLTAGQSYDAYLRSQCLPTPLMIIGVYDGPLSGGNPKGVELYVADDIEDLSEYGIGSANNGEGSDGVEFTFPAVAVAAGTHLHFTSDRELFNDFFGFYPDYVDPSALINGDDAVELFHDGTIIDRFGDSNVDGTDEVWEYKDGWAYREPNWTANGGNFNPNKWTYSGTDVLEGGPNNGSCDVPFPVNTFNGPSNLFSAWVGPVSFTTKPPAPECGGFFYDVGGANNAYPANQLDTVTICPDEAGYEVTLNFNLFDVEANGSVCLDNFYIFDGENTSSPLIKPGGGSDSWCWDQSGAIPFGSGDLTGKEITSTDESGCLTIVFQSNAQGNNQGWEAEVLCEPRPYCPAAEDLRASNVTENSVVLEWTSVAPQVEGVQLSWGLAGISPEEGTVVEPGAYPFVLNNLSPGTAYEFYVKESCGNFGDGNWAGPHRFFTSCSSSLGDNFSNPIPVNGLPYTGYGSTEACYSNTMGHTSADAYYQFTTDDCVFGVKISTCNEQTDFDTYLRLLDQEGNQLAINDDATGCAYLVNGVNRLSTLTASVQPNTTYFVVVEGFGPSQGQFQIDLEVVDQPTLEVHTTTQPTSCPDEADGSIVLTVEGGAAPYTFNWSNGTDTKDLEEVTAGVYAVTVQDACGQEFASKLRVESPNPLVLTTQVNHATRPDAANGSIELQVAGGQAPYTFNWSNQETTRNLIDLIPGTYCVEISDRRGCSIEECFIVNGGLTNTSQPELIDAISVYPNPTREVALLKLDLIRPANLELKVVDATGSNLWVYRTTEVKKLIYNLDFQDYPNGVYFLQLVIDQEVYTHRIVVSR